MKSFIFIVFYLCSVGFVYSQKNSEENKSYNLSAKFGIGITKFAVVGFETEDYPAMATRLGFAISKTVIGNRILVESGLNFYYRAKSKSPLVDEIYWYGKGALFPTLDDTATQRHFAFEVPIIIKYLLTGNKSINTGIIVRKWQPKDQDPVSLLASQTELGCVLGISQQIIKDLSIVCDIFIGFKDFYPGLVIGSSGGIMVKNRSALFSIAYSF
ncbi:hypothetical protein MATR_27790 [Marivirga tractuosa]|uniref:Outer membrane protein beta-barrel domain-containing protein n=1 Tax=Marivirga tractuosa (strain ATCC 23168 / DSM 4126 / NBRC 15989 / NCIMB 1408 / VKM B-1430 / H-43) TaxID=643867 RepID=E4TLU2_MARTH|nr:hypothetical protein [Marivirga tractuosa]ADR23371.1 hypothetical protein Ftrac_3397 [Marivirga tractuosa DSM 4126]BDD15954.1 hypothetical protein MATR_27790 [Marivirga tractuosa]